MSKFKFNDWDKSLIRLGAYRERRRIRRALQPVRAELLWQAEICPPGSAIRDYWGNMVAALAAATSTRRKRK